MINMQNVYKFFLQFSIIFLLLMEMTVMPDIAKAFFLDLFKTQIFIVILAITVIFL